MSTKNVGIGYFTGRRNFKNLVRTYIRTWQEFGLIINHNITLNLFITYDLKYRSTKLKDFKGFDDEVYNLSDSVSLIGISDIRRESRELVENEILTKKEVDLIFGEGYAKRRNAVIYFAVKNKMDYLLFLDDDEYPLAPFLLDNKRLMWIGQNVLGSHIRNIEGADITHGYHCGYISPIPFIEFNEVLTEEDFKTFIEAISNDIIKWDLIKERFEKTKGVDYADTEIIVNPKAYEIEEKDGCKFISGSNLCINLKSIKNIAPFYNPPGARGEDTFLSTCLKDLVVKKIPTYTFHDGFLNYSSLLCGVLPRQLKPVSTSNRIITKRFLNACIGWVRYKPLLLYITQQDTYEKQIKDMRESLIKTIPKLCNFFSDERFNEILTELDYYNKNVKKHYKSFQETKAAWSKLLSSIQ